MSNIQYATGSVGMDAKMSPMDEAKYHSQWVMEKYGRFVKAINEAHLNFNDLEQMFELHKELTGVVAKKITANLKKAKVRK